MVSESEPDAMKFLMLAERERAEVAETKLGQLEAKATALRLALVLARQYVVKGNEAGAYADCVMSGDLALARIDAALSGK